MKLRFVHGRLPSLILETENAEDCIALVEIIRDEGQRRGWVGAVDQIDAMLAERRERGDG